MLFPLDIYLVTLASATFTAELQVPAAGTQDNQDGLFYITGAIFNSTCL